MINIDASTGEGGGQILRSCLSLSAITGKPFYLYQIRANRKNPGLAAQHLTGVKAIAEICNAEIKGAKLGSMTLEFIPQSLLKGGNYVFDVAENREGGSAGSVSLVLQTILLPLAFAEDDSKVIIKGGTHVAFSPPLNYIEEVYLPFMEQIGIEAKVKLNHYGWYPKGGGEIELTVMGKGQKLGNYFQSLQLLERGNLKQITGKAIVTQLPVSISQRMINASKKILDNHQLRNVLKAQKEQGNTAGTGIFLTAKYQNSVAAFSGLGKRGLSSEKVAEIAVNQLLEYHQSDAPIDQYMGDQLLLPLSQCPEKSQYKVAKITQHLITNAWVIEQFDVAKIDINSDNNIVTIIKNSI